MSQAERLKSNVRPTVFLTEESGSGETSLAKASVGLMGLSSYGSNEEGVQRMPTQDSDQRCSLNGRPREALQCRDEPCSS